jgi:hypothetical protein
MKKMVWTLGLLAILISCGEKKKQEQPKEAFISAVSFIRSQVTQVDTSLYSIMKLVYRDSVYVDTEYIKREDFAANASDFLDLPDIADKKNAPDYLEEKFVDETLNRVIFTYRPKDPEKALIQRQELVVLADLTGGESKVRNIIIETSSTNRDSSVQKKLLWQVDKSFQVTRIIQKNAQPETTYTFKVTWNEDKEE